MITRVCRFCGEPLTITFADLGMSPLSNAYVSKEKLFQKEIFYPLHAFVCANCFLVQVNDVELPEKIFSDYAYFSSYSDTWLKHSQEYASMAISRFCLTNNSAVIELASNDGYLLQYFKEVGIPVLGIEPAGNVALEAKRKGIPTIVNFFGQKLAQELVSQGEKADLVIGNNVLAHVPDINDFVAGMKILLKQQGIITLEFPHLMRLMEGNQFDTIYHEHFSYISLTTALRILDEHGLTIFDVDEIPTHGGSLRIYACHKDDTSKSVGKNVTKLLADENRVGLAKLNRYRKFEEQVKETKRKILELLIRIKYENKSIVGYGAPAKGNTLLNYCGIRRDFIDYTVDRNPYKQGKYLPGSHIPIYDPEKIMETKPDYVFILPWNLTQEIMDQMGCIRDWGGKFIIPIPEVKVV